MTAAKCLLLFALVGLLRTHVYSQEPTDAEIETLLSAAIHPDSPGAPAEIEGVNQHRQQQLENLFKQLFNGQGPDATLIDVHEDGILARHELPVKNVQVTLPGIHADKVILLGAHLDQVPRPTGQTTSPHGIIDDWSGVALLVKLYEHLSQHADRHGPFHHTFVFVGFAYEESGLWGSESYVNQLANEGKLSHVKAMVNFECLGVSDLFTWDNGSTEWLEELGEMVASNLDGVELKRRMLTGVGADSVPFILNHRPAITIDSLSRADFGKIHTPEDNRGNINNDKYRAAFRFASSYLKELDATLEAAPNLADHHQTLPSSFAAYQDVSSLRRISWEPTSASIVPVPFGGFGVRPLSDGLRHAMELRFQTAIDAANQEWLQAAKAGDATRLANVYTKDATIFPSDAESVTGRSSIEKYYADLFQKLGGGIATNFIRDSLIVSDHVAYERGVYTGSPTVESFVVWTPSRIEGRLVAKMHFDGWRNQRQTRLTTEAASSFVHGEEAFEATARNRDAHQIAPGVIAIRRNGKWEIITVKNGVMKRTPLEEISTTSGTNIFAE